MVDHRGEGVLLRCGRATPRFPLGVRSMNKRGRLVSDRLAYGEAIVGDSPETIEWVDDGYRIVPS
jgi:hypothetical protein